MIGRVIEIATDHRHLALSRGFMIVCANGSEVGRVPLDDIGIVIANSHGLTYSNNLLVALAERGVILVLCTSNHNPVAMLWPLDGHHVQASRMQAQIEAGKPLRKRLWQLVVRQKIAQQAAVLESLGLPGGVVDGLRRRVKSGDPENIEAQASRRYWPILMGREFRRDRSQPGANALLNYGYMVLRAATARAIVAAGLHPSIGIHHHHPGNNFRLADDLMEPFRPLVDRMVVKLIKIGEIDVTPETKKMLASLTTVDMVTEAGTSPLSTCLLRLATSLARAFETGQARLDFPIRPLPLEMPDH